MLKGKTALVTGSTSGIGLAIARALAQDGANVMLNGFGDKTEIEKNRAGIEKDFGVKARYSAADMSKPAEIADMITHDGKGIRLARRAGQQRRHPARRDHRGFPDREMGRDHRHQPVVRVPHHPRRRARHEDDANGAASSIPLRRIGWSPRRSKVAYVSAKHGLVGLTKTVALETANFGITCNAICPG